MEPAPNVPLGLADTFSANMALPKTVDWIGGGFCCASLCWDPTLAWLAGCPVMLFIQLAWVAN